MAGIGCLPQPHQMLLLPKQRNHGVLQCCSNNPNSRKERTQTPKFLKLAVTGVTELLRLLSQSDKNRSDTTNSQIDENLVSNIDDILMIIKSDYEKAYFVTGHFTSAIYADECTFEDPTIKFQGRDLYSRNLKLLVPFFDNPSIFLKEIKKISLQYQMDPVPHMNVSGSFYLLIECGLLICRDSGKIELILGINPKAKYIIASWKLRTHLKLPWRPLILIDGTTTYDIDDQLRVIKHVESWKISALEAIGQIFTPGFLRSDK
ncbi:uncharacterized protein LOC113760071 [Coffea eugenioides]|uniref:uncharacterized protein LOC113760071 n=1 Tax=Coffea eugenioides TaxID=49369 RepID=UPI000F6106B8|nr:uncharacterized protein LOC113760071 [Coffea eugenioides]